VEGKESGSGIRLRSRERYSTN